MKVPRSKIVPLVVACALFMEHIDGSIIATAVPSIAQSLGADPLHLNLAITSYMLSLAVFIPLSGWVADRFGARSVFCSAIVVFIIGSLACGLSQNLGQLIASRIIQGAGGAMMVPVGRLVLLRSVSKSELVDAMAWFTAPAMVGPILGPPIGGLIVTYASWRWIFLVNVPISLLGIYLAQKYIQNSRGERKEPLDVSGFVMVAVALVGLMFSFETIGRGLVPLPAIISFFTVGSVCATLYLLHVRQHKNPIIDLGLLKFKTFRASLTGGSLFRISIGALPFLLPLLLQYGFGMTPAMSGFITLASAAGAMLMKIVAKTIIRAVGFRSVLLGNALLNTAFLAGISKFNPHGAWSLLFLFLLIGGFFRSLQFTALNTFAFAEIPDRLMSRANTFYNMMQQLNLSLGVAVGAMILNLTMYFHGAEKLSAEHFTPAFLGTGLICLLSSFAFLSLSNEAGAEISGHRVRRDGGDESEQQDL